MRSSELPRSPYIKEQGALLVDKVTSVHHDHRSAPKEVADDRKKEEGGDTATRRRHMDLTFTWRSSNVRAGRQTQSRVSARHITVAVARRCRAPFALETRVGRRTARPSGRVSATDGDAQVARNSDHRRARLGEPGPVVGTRRGAAVV